MASVKNAVRKGRSIVVPLEENGPQEVDLSEKKMGVSIGAKPPPHHVARRHRLDY
jgi:hypothetical protein